MKKILLLSLVGIFFSLPSFAQDLSHFSCAVSVAEIIVTAEFFPVGNYYSAKINSNGRTQLLPAQREVLSVESARRNVLVAKLAKSILKVDWQQVGQVVTFQAGGATEENPEVFAVYYVNHQGDILDRGAWMGSAGAQACH